MSGKPLPLGQRFGALTVIRTVPGGRVECQSDGRYYAVISIREILRDPGATDE